MEGGLSPDPSGEPHHLRRLGRGFASLTIFGELVLVGLGRKASLDPPYKPRAQAIGSSNRKHAPMPPSAGR